MAHNVLCVQSAEFQKGGKKKQHQDYADLSLGVDLLGWLLLCFNFKLIGIPNIRFIVGKDSTHSRKIKQYQHHHFNSFQHQLLEPGLDPEVHCYCFLIR